MAALVAVRRLGRLEPRAAAEADPLQPERDRREREAKQLGDLRRRHPEPAELLDRIDPRRRQLGRRAVRPRAAVDEARFPFLAPALQPAPGGALADAGRLGGRRQRPLLALDPLDEQLPAVRTGAGITVELHPVSSLGLSWLRHLSASKGARMVLLTNVLRSYI